MGLDIYIRGIAINYGLYHTTEGGVESATTSGADSVYHL